jgi:hypothetical protein
MKSIIKNVLLMSVYHIAKETVTNIEVKMKEEDKNEKELKSKMLLLGAIHTLLGILYND